MRLSPRAGTLFSLLFNAAASATLTLSRDTQSTLFLWVKYRDAGAQYIGTFPLPRETDNCPTGKGQEAVGGWLESVFIGKANRDSQF